MSVSHHSLQPLRPFSRCACRLPLSRICKSGMTHKLTCTTHTLTTHYSPALHNPTVTGYNFLTLIVPAVYTSKCLPTHNQQLVITNQRKKALTTNRGFFLPSLSCFGQYLKKVFSFDLTSLSQVKKCNRMSF